MPWIEDIARPSEDLFVIHSTLEMNADAAYAWFNRPLARKEKATLQLVLCSTFGTLHDDDIITKHFPKPFLVRFKFPLHYANAVSRHDFDFEQLRV
jgi:hypothetical protein